MRIHNPDAFAEKHERNEHQIVCKEHAAEDSCYDRCVSQRFHPVEKVNAESEADQLLANAHGDEHFGGIRRVYGEKVSYQTL